MVLLSLFIALAGLLGSAVAGTYSQVTNFGENSSGARMYMYMPTTLAPNPPIIVAIHWCSGTAQAYYTSTPYAQYADTYGFIVIYPESPYSGTCWDVSSRATLTHDGGANSNSIANMVRYVLRTYSADASRVFVTGTSSGAMMTNVLAATYPDIFAAGIAYSGVPAGCFYTGTVNGWNSTCSQGNVVNTAQQWANVVFDMYPGYTGPRPRMQIYHGSVDNVLYPNNFNETVKQWSGVFGYSAPQQVLNGVPGAQYVKYIYGPQLEAIYGVGVGHSVNVMGAEDLRWFGIVYHPLRYFHCFVLSGFYFNHFRRFDYESAYDNYNYVVPTGNHDFGVVRASVRWGQCGGNNWTGPRTCESPWTCTFLSDWYSQCL